MRKLLLYSKRSKTIGCCLSPRHLNTYVEEITRMANINKVFNINGTKIAYISDADD